jgi:hypothetical protein
MKTIAFYSYKGGVGRSLSVAHVANCLGQMGKSVFMLDMDMDAPGLHYKASLFYQKLNPSAGLVDYIHHFQTTGQASRDLSTFIHPLIGRHRENAPAWLMPAGNPFRDDYWTKLGQINWKEFLFGEKMLGSLLFLELKASIEKIANPDYLLIDSGTGMNDLTGIGLELLADDAVVLALSDAENVDGSRLVLERLRRMPKLSFKEFKTKLHFVLTRQPEPKNDVEIEHEWLLRDDVMEHLHEGSGLASGKLVDCIHIIHSDEEQNRQNPFRWGGGLKSSDLLVSDYGKLVYALTGLGDPVALDL